MASSGLDLAIVVGGFTAVGWWLDRRYGWAPTATLTGAILGIVGGMANFLREAKALGRAPNRSAPDSVDSKEKDEAAKGPDAP